MSHTGGDMSGASIEFTSNLIGNTPEYRAETYLDTASNIGHSRAFRKICREWLGGVDIDELKWIVAHVYLAGPNSVNVPSTL
jgi:hypothetical protein